MLQISEPQFRLLTQNAKLLSGSKDKPKVLETQDNLIIKLFHPRKLFTSAKFYSHARRFKKNSERLLKAGIHSVAVQNILRCPSQNADIAVYEKVKGDAVREQVDKGNNDILHRLPHYLAELHQKGVFFRGIHLGNLIIQPNDSFCIIDHVGLKVKSRPLNLWQRARNLRHLLLDRNDHHIFKTFGYQHFITQYLQSLQLCKFKTQLLQFFIHKEFKKVL